LNLTSNFLQWRTKKKVDLNLTALVKWDAPKSGNKGGVVGTRKRKGGRSTGVEPDEVVNPFRNVSGFFDKKFMPPVREFAMVVLVNSQAEYLDREEILKKNERKKVELETCIFISTMNA
jgi:hypothetical protein